MFNYLLQIDYGDYEVPLGIYTTLEKARNAISLHSEKDSFSTEYIIYCIEVDSEPDQKHEERIGFRYKHGE
jgi:hypothetical protein